MGWILAIAALCNNSNIYSSTQLKCQQWYIRCIDKKLDVSKSVIDSVLETKWEGPLKSCVLEKQR